MLLEARSRCLGWGGFTGEDFLDFFPFAEMKTLLQAEVGLGRSL